MNYYTIIKTRVPFDIHQTLFSGQSFLWNINKDEPDFYATIIKYKPFIIKQIADNELEVYAEDEVINGIPLVDFIFHYFTLDIDTEQIFPDNFSHLYPTLWQLLTDYFPVRIMRQDPFETMISFMCAQGIGMPLIRKQVSMLLLNYGEKRTISYSGKEITLHHFPSPERLAAANPIALSTCTNNNHPRARNIVRIAKGVADGKIDLDALSDPLLPLSELRRTLCQNEGVGYKIADCIALFGLGRFDAFPIDTHVKQYLGQWFSSTTALQSLTPARYLALDAEARTILKPDFAGYAGHLLFHCWRKEIKGLRTF